MEAKIYSKVRIADNAKIGEHVVIGVPPRGKQDGEIETVIGENAVIRSHTVIYAGNKIGKNFQTGHGALIRENNEIGDDVSVGSHSVVEFSVKIGNRVSIHSGAFVPEHCELKDDCWIGPHVVLTNAPYPKSKRAKETLKGVTVSEHAKVGANATVLPGVIIGKHALVGSGAVVTKNVEENAVVIGNPAAKIKDVSELKYEDTGELVYNHTGTTE
jgi:acetyltransferase-like isoleucine patch superfamily enzyme